MGKINFQYRRLNRKPGIQKGGLPQNKILFKGQEALQNTPQN